MAAASVSIPCPACKAKSKVPVNKITEKGVIYVCPNCRTKIMAAREGRKISARKATDGEVSALEPPPPEPPPLPEKKDDSPPPWVVTFADLATLLLTFFVLILSFSNMDVVKYKQLVGSVQDRFGVSELATGSYQSVSKGAVRDVDSNILKASPHARRNQLVSVVYDAVMRTGYQGAASITTTDNGVRVRMKGRVLFKPGSADLDKRGLGFLKSVINLLNEHPGLLLVVEGHTDNSKIYSKRYPTNWELSTGRATAILEYLVKIGAPKERLSAAGFADARPLFSNLRQETRILNRRVEFLFTRE